MYSNDEFLADEFERSRPGLHLVWVEEAALPFSWVKLEVLAQERKSFPLLEEFTLRAVESGLSSEHDIGFLLGLEDEIVSATVADLMQRDYVVRKPVADGQWRIGLTALGVGAAKELSAVSPTSAQVGIAFDRLKWRVTAFRREDLVSHREAKVRGLRVLPGLPADLSERDFAPQALNRMLSHDEEREDRVEILAVQKMTPKARLLLPVKILIFSDNEASETQIGVVIDRELSREHELEIERLGGAEELGIEVGAPLPAPLDGLPNEAISQRVSLEELERIRVSAADSAGNAIQSQAGSAVRGATREAMFDDLEVRALSVHEHRGMLANALNGARTRLLIIAPRLERAVVDDDFISLLDRRLRQNVRVTVAYGDSDETAVGSLRELAKRFAKHFDLVRAENVRQPALVWDNSWVLSNFGWLSFKGDLARTYRLAEGTLIRVQTLVDEAYERYLAEVAREPEQVRVSQGNRAQGFPT